MAIVTVNLHPSRKDLRDFGEISLAMTTTIALILYWWKDLPGHWALSICAAGLAIYLLSRIWPPLVKPISLALTILTAPIGWVVGHCIMTAVYLLIFTPIGLLFRIVGRDPLERRFEPDAQTYWQPKSTPDDLARYYRQF